MWTQPKTDWKQNDFFASDDYLRICSNIVWLQKKAAQLYPRVTLAPMQQLANEALPYLAYFEAPDSNVDRLLSGTYSAATSERARIYHEEGSAWSAADVNRIEGACLRLYQIFAAQQAAQPGLAFTLGGEELNETI